MEKKKSERIKCPNEKCPNRSRVYYRMREKNFACGGCGTIFDQDGKVIKSGRT